ncbi:hypothetical protein [Salmonella enterica]
MTMYTLCAIVFCIVIVKAAR